MISLVEAHETFHRCDRTSDRDVVVGPDQMEYTAQSKVIHYDVETISTILGTLNERLCSIRCETVDDRVRAELKFESKEFNTTRKRITTFSGIDKCPFRWCPLPFSLPPMPGSALLSDLFGYTSIACWLGAQFPYVNPTRLFELPNTTIHQSGPRELPPTIMRRPCYALSR